MAAVVVVVVRAAAATSTTSKPLYHPTCQIFVPLPPACVDDAGIEEFMINDFTALAAS